MISQYVILDNLEMCNVKNVTDYYLIKKCKYILTKKIANVPKINKQWLACSLWVCEVVGSRPGGVKPKTMKLVLVASLLTMQL